MNVKILVAALCCGLSFSSIAANQKASISYNNTTGLWSNPALWNLNREPQDGDFILLDSSANKSDVTLTLDHDVTNTLWRIRFVPKAGTTTILDGDGHTIIAHETDEEYLGTELFHVMGLGDYSHAFSVEQPGSSAYYKSVPYMLVDPKFQIYVDDEGYGTVKFVRGTYNFAGGGDTIDTARTVIIGGNHKLNPFHTWFAGGTFQMPTFNYKANCPTNVITISGADTYMKINGTFSSYLGGWAPEVDCGAKRADFVVTDGARLDLAGLLEWRMNEDADTKYVSYRKYCPDRLFAVRNGATVNVGAKGLFNSRFMRFEVSDATFNASSYDLQFGAIDSASNYVFALDKAIWNAGSGSTTIGNADCATPAVLAVTNSTISGQAGNWLFYNTVGQFVDTSFGSAPNKLLRVSRGSQVKVDGGSFSGQALQVGYGDIWGSEAGATLTIADGEHEFYDIYIGRGIGANSATSVLHQTGGKIRVVGSGSGGSWAFCDVVAIVGENETGEGQTGCLKLDGGVFEASQVKGSSGAANQGGPGWALLSADGGTLLVGNSPVSPFWLGQFDRAEIGTRGLTIDTADRDAKAVQDFVDKAGEKGTLVKDGAGTLTLEVADYSVATTRVERGTLALVPASADAFRTTLEVGRNGTFSLVGAPTAATVEGLSVDGGTVALDADDVITVNGPVSLNRLALRFSSEVSLGDSFDWLVVKGELPDDVKAELQRALLANNVADGAHASFAFDFDGEKTTVKAAIVPDVDPIGEDDTTAWQGTTSDWTTGGNWSKGVPTAGKKAQFASATAEKDVTVPADALVGAVQFDADGYRLSGGSLALAAEQGASQVGASAGESEIASPMEFYNVVRMPVEADAKLTLSGEITGGGFKKSGTGELVLGASNDFRNLLTFGGGRVVGAAEGALNGPRAVLVRDTLAVDGDCASIPDLTIRAPDQAASVILDIRTNATVGGIANDAGAIVKRGAGSLVLDVKAGSANVLGSWKTGTTWGLGAATNAEGKIVNNGVCAYTTNFEFPADGSSITAGYSGFTIAEGDVTVRKPADVTASHVYASSSVLVGMPLATCACEPSLTIDGAYFNAREQMPSSTHFFNGAYLGVSGNAVKRSTVRILNGGTLFVDTYRSGYGSTAEGAVALTVITNGTLKGGYTTHYASTSGKALSVYRVKDANLWGGQVSVSAQFQGTVDMDAENSSLANLNGGLVALSLSNASAGRVFFHDGGVFYVATISSGYAVVNDFTFAFDDTEWRGAASGSYTLARQENYNGHVFFEMIGKGVIFDPKAGNTVTVDLPFSGAGGLQVKSGTVAFAADSYGFTGPCAVSEGAVADLTNAGAIDTAAFAGPGTVRNATVRRARIVQDVADDWTGGLAPTFDGSAVTGRLTVDFGRTEANPLSETLPQGLVIAKLVNGSTLASKSVKLLNTGREHIVGIARVTKDGDVVMDVINAGLMMIVR